MQDENEVRGLFADAVADGGPALSIGPEDIARRGAAVRRRRRRLAMAGSSLAVVALAAVAAILLATALRRPALIPATPHPTIVTPVTGPTGSNIPAAPTGGPATTGIPPRPTTER